MKIKSLILSDGTRGMENQYIAISKYLNLNYKVLRIKPNFFIKNFPKLTSIFYIFFKNKILFLKKFNFRYLVTTGRRMSGYSILAKKSLKKKAQKIDEAKDELIDEVVPFSVYFGPKLGSFYQKKHQFQIDGLFLKNVMLQHKCRVYLYWLALIVFGYYSHKLLYYLLEI